MKVLSLFDGISCGYLALRRAGIPIDAYYASEIDNTCIKVSQKHFPDIIRLGDVNNWRTWDSPEYGHVFSGKRMDSGCDSPSAKRYRA